MSKVNLKSLGRNFLFAAIAEIWRLGSRFFLTPITIGYVGLEGYGTWALLFSICSYISMFNVSFGLAYAKYTAEYDSKGDYRTLSSIVSSGVSLIGGLAIIVLSAMWAFRIPILSWLNIPSHLIGDAAIALSIVMFCLFLRMSVGCTFDVLSGMQRADLNYKTDLLGSVIEFTVTLPLLIAGWGLVGLGVGYASGQIISTGLAWILCHKVCPNLSISPFRASRSGLRFVIGLGGQFQILSFINIILDSGIKLLLSHLLGVKTVGIYELAYKLLGLATTISNSLLGPLMPAFANLHASREFERAQQLFTGGSKAVAIVSGTALGFVALFADQLVFAWTGHQFPEAAWTLRMLAAPKFLTMLTGVPTASLRGRGIVKFEMWYAIIGGILLISSIIPLYQIAGYRGVIYSLNVANVGGTIWFLWTFFRYERASPFGYLHNVFGKVGLSVGVAMIAVATGRGTFPAIELSHLPLRWSAAVSAIAWAVPFLLITLIAARYLVLSQEEIERLKDIVRRKFGPESNPDGIS